MKNINRLLLTVVALVGMQSIANAAAAATPFDNFKTALLQYEQVLLKGKKLDPVAHYNILEAVRSTFNATNDIAIKREMRKLAASKGLNVEGLQKRMTSLKPLVDKIEASHNAAALDELQAENDRIDQEMIAARARDAKILEADKILDESAAGSIPGSPRGPVIDDSAAPSEADDDDDIQSLSGHIGAQPAASAGAGSGSAAAPARSYPDVIPNSLMEKMLAERYPTDPSAAAYPYGNSGPAYRRLNATTWMK